MDKKQKNIPTIKMEEGHCPKCGSDNLEYGESGPEGNSYYYEFTCLDCGAKGREWYSMEYSESILDEDLSGSEVEE